MIREIDPQIPPSTPRMSLVSRAIVTASAGSFQAGRATERMSQIGREARDEIAAILAGRLAEGQDPIGPEGESPVTPEAADTNGAASTPETARSFMGKLVTDAAKSGAQLATRKVLGGVADRLEEAPKASKKVRAAAWMIRAAEKNV